MFLFLFVFPTATLAEIPTKQLLDDVSIPNNVESLSRYRISSFKSLDFEQRHLTGKLLICFTPTYSFCGYSNVFRNHLDWWVFLLKVLDYFHIYLSCVQVDKNSHLGLEIILRLANDFPRLTFKIFITKEYSKKALPYAD